MEIENSCKSLEMNTNQNRSIVVSVMNYNLNRRSLLFSLAAILDDSKSKSDVTFISLKKSMTDLLLQFLTVETDLINTHMLLGN